jgi:hypothetical protein
MLNLQQPAAGILATFIVMIVSLGFVSLFELATFTGWVSYALICIIPAEIVIGVTWGCNHPAFAARQPQPLRGLTLMLLAAIAGVIAGAVYFTIVGGGISPPTPMLAMAGIVSVVVTFWASIIWGGWPFTALIKNPVGAGIAILIACYVVNYLLFRVLFNYDFMMDAPGYVPELDPHGLFNAWHALVFYITAIGVMFLMLHFDLWPLSASPKLMRQPVLGVVWTLICLSVGGIVLYLGVFIAGMDVVRFMVTVPIPFIFGTIVVLNMLQASLFAKLKQPVKGLWSAAVAAVVGVALAKGYGALAPAVTGTVNAGPPAYDFEIWLASALLAVTFPFLIFYAEFFQFWLLKKPQGS